MLSVMFQAFCESQHIPVLMGYCKKDVTPSLTHLSYVYLALTHQYVHIIVAEFANVFEWFTMFQITFHAECMKDNLKCHETCAIVYKPLEICSWYFKPCILLEGDEVLHVDHMSYNLKCNILPKFVG